MFLIIFDDVKLIIFLIIASNFSFFSNQLRQGTLTAWFENKLEPVLTGLSKKLKFII